MLLWSIIKPPCCWVVLEMLWDTGTGCGSTMSQDQPFIRQVHGQNTSHITLKMFLQWGSVCPFIFIIVINDYSHLLHPLRSLRSLVAWRISRLSSLTGRWVTTQFCTWQRLKVWQLVSSEMLVNQFGSCLSPLLTVSRTRNWLDWFDHQRCSDEASSGRPPPPLMSASFVCGEKWWKCHLTFTVRQCAISLLNRCVTSLKLLERPASEQVISLAGKTGEELLHEVAARYVEGMKDMEGRAPGPSSIWGESWLDYFYHDLFVAVGQICLFV